jgi:hypothetical protein
MTATILGKSRILFSQRNLLFGIYMYMVDDVSHFREKPLDRL